MNKSTNQPSARSAANWLGAMPMPQDGVVRVNVTLALEPGELAVVAAAMMNQRACLAAIIHHALWWQDAVIKLSESKTPVDGVYGTANQCPACRDYDPSIEQVTDLETGAVVLDSLCGECGQALAT